MSKKTLTQEEIEDVVTALVNNKKYAELNLPRETVRDLILQELPKHKQVKQVLQSVRKKLHNIVAPYLGDPDYAQTEQTFLALAAAKDQAGIKALCCNLLDLHASTKERQPILEDFYQRIFAYTGIPNRILDVACALHPFGLPWMGLPQSTEYYAYDLHQPRINLINVFFKTQNRPELGIYQDILVEPPKLTADMAFFFKEAHRFEQRQRGCNRNFWIALQVKYLLVSLPTNSLSGKHDKADQHRRLVYENTDGLGWKITEIPFQNEIVFCIEK